MLQANLRPNPRRRKAEPPPRIQLLIPPSHPRRKKVSVEWFVVLGSAYGNTPLLTEASQSTAREQNAPIDVDVASPSCPRNDDIVAQAPSRAPPPGEEATAAPCAPIHSTNVLQPSPPGVRVVRLYTIIMHQPWSKYSFPLVITGRSCDE